MKKAHLVLGSAMVLFFLWTGWWMSENFPEAYHRDNGVRMLYRSSHLYLLLAGLLNLALGSYLVRPTGPIALFQAAGSWLVMAGTIGLVAAFFLEPSAGSLARPVTLPSIVGLLVGTLIHFLLAVVRGPVRSQKRKSPSRKGRAGTGKRG